MSKNITVKNLAYIAGFLDGDGSIYVRLKPNPTYRFGFQVSPCVAFFQAKKEKENFARVCSLAGAGYMRERKDGIMEYVINKKDDIVNFLSQVKPYLILKKRQAELMIQILEIKEAVKDQKDFEKLAGMIDKFRELNYSKKRKRHNLTP
jgi:intein-encoded DNA endonuclease-like protein